MKYPYLLFIALFLFKPSLDAAGAFTWHDNTGGGRLELRESGRPVFTYNYGPQLAGGVPADRKRCCYVHPVWAPNGAVVTGDFPVDHYHHRGIFWAWPVVRVSGDQYDGWMMRGGLEKRWIRWLHRSDGVHAKLGVENGWYVGDRLIAREQVAMSAMPSVAGKRDLEFAISLQPTEAPVELTGAPEQNKGYGGFSVRFAQRTNTVIRTDAGTEPKDTDMVPHPWAELQANYGGKIAALRIAVDLNNPGYPNGWCLRNYGFLGVNYPGTKPAVLEKGRPLLLKYTVTVSGG